MARKSITITIEADPDVADSRDTGKVFILTELPATLAEKWAARAVNALLASGIEIPDSVARQGMRGLAASGMTNLQSFSGMPWDLAEPLLDEMMKCISIIPDPNRPAVCRPLIEDDIEEVKTRLKLRGEWLKLHFGFSFTAKSSTSGPAAVTAAASSI